MRYIEVQNEQQFKKMNLERVEKRSMMIRIVQLQKPEEKKKVTREVLESLQDWFGIPEAREEYITKSVNQLFWCAYDGDKNVGFLYLHETGKDTVELYVMGIRKEYHRMGIGKALFNVAYEFVRINGYSFIQVKTVQMGKYKNYDDTNMFYLSLGFKEFEVFPNLWDEWNPCQVYVMTIR